MDSNHRSPPCQGGAFAPGPQDPCYVLSTQYSVSTPARIRTRNATVETWSDFRFTTRVSSVVSTPARNRTWTSTFGGWRPVRWTTRVAQRRGRDSNPYAREGNRVSTAARPAVSGSRPYSSQWTRRESNPDRQHARPASSHWTTSPPQWSRGESNPVAVFARHSSSPLASPTQGPGDRDQETVRQPPGRLSWLPSPASCLLK